MPVSKIITFRVEVTVQDRAWELFHDSNQFNADWGRATEGAAADGSDTYYKPTLWAEFDNEAAAITCDSLLRNLAERYAERAKQYDIDAANEEN
jgi:hypothetical protein